jgi:hypothetical protein
MSDVYQSRDKSFIKQIIPGQPGSISTAPYNPALISHLHSKLSTQALSIVGDIVCRN